MQPSVTTTTPPPLEEGEGSISSARMEVLTRAWNPTAALVMGTEGKAGAEGEATSNRPPIMRSASARIWEICKDDTRQHFNNKISMLILFYSSHVSLHLPVGCGDPLSDGLQAGGDCGQQALDVVLADLPAMTQYSPRVAGVERAPGDHGDKDPWREQDGAAGDEEWPAHLPEGAPECVQGGGGGGGARVAVGHVGGGWAQVEGEREAVLVAEEAHPGARGQEGVAGLKGNEKTSENSEIEGNLF